MKKSILLGCALFFLALPLHAQSFDASLGYSYFRLDGSGFSQNGVSGSIAYNPNHWLGLVGDFGGYHGSPSGVPVNTYTFLLGPRFSLRNSTKVTPFVQGLVGGSHLYIGPPSGPNAISVATNQFTYSFGGGADFGLLPRLALRLQLDYIGLHNSGLKYTNCTRVSVGLVVHF